MDNNSLPKINDTTKAPVYSSLYPYEARAALVGVWILTCILGLVGNSLVIWSVILSKKLRTVTNAFVVNLSVADFWTSLSYPWICVALVSNESWPLESEVPCVIAAIQLYTGLGASLYSLASIALNRMVLVTQTMNTYSWWYTPRKVAVMIAMTWVCPCIVFFLPPILGIGVFGYDPQDNTCSDKDGHPRGPEYNLAQSVGLYPVPMLIIICCYTALYIHLKQHFRKMKKKDNMELSQTLSVDTTTRCQSHVPNRVSTASSINSVSTLQDSSVRHRQAISRQQLAITKNLFLVFCIFASLLSPYFISLAIPSSRKFALYGVTITVFNSCVNPIIYAVNHPQFKVVMRKIVKCRYSEIQEPSDLLKLLLSLRKN
ncbi:G-protein coupled receptor moody-like [Asterias rubens]|uniref:G-protein coupled receptor moody-like n=1 Tax=Asterias rubens TaxID=7604 RepID=UPI0014554007|nr:G-protein coupled receptor moody-like [Asterias rubens]